MLLYRCKHIRNQYEGDTNLTKCSLYNGESKMTKIKKKPTGRPGEFDNRVCLAVYVDKETAEKLKEVANGVPLSTYIRRLLLDNIKKL